ncbi:MAG: ABC transporter ATP-binding protein/permease [Candidatus Saccharibacteria bacterium]|nr:ABC transporter ATP-binding protein/permease [Candidatus Saccharibacteria bacterium]
MRKKGVAKLFLRSIKPFGFWIIFAVVLAIGSAVLGLFTPKILGEMTDIAKDSFATGLDWDALGMKITIVIILFTSSSILNYFQAYILGVVTAKYTKSLRKQILEKITRLPISYFDNHQFGDTLSCMTNDIDIIATSMSQEIADVSLSLTTLIGVMVIMLTISIPLSIVTFIVVPLSVFVVAKIAKFAQKYFKKQQATLAVLNSKIEESYSNQIIIKSNSYEKTALADFDKTNKELATTSRKAQFFASLAFPVTHIFTNLGYVAVCILGGYLVIERRISLGNLQAFIGYVSRFNRPITEVASTTSTIQSLLAASERIFNFLNADEEEPDPENNRMIEEVKGAVVFDHIKFSYDKKHTVIKDFSANILPGQKVAIVGPTGAGKTTIINLLMRFYEPDSGSITIDDVPINEMTRADVRTMFGMVLQDTWLFSGSIEDNLRYGNQQASLNEIEEAAKISNIHHTIKALPKGYESTISENSDNISAGEKQLLTIARAIVANPSMIILDEATSNVDTRTEQLIQAAFDKITKGRTSFIIAHRLSTIRNADLILVMKDGDIVEQGTHDALLKKNGFYAELYNSQFTEE